MYFYKLKAGGGVDVCAAEFGRQQQQIAFVDIFFRTAVIEQFAASLNADDYGEGAVARIIYMVEIFCSTFRAAEVIEID